MQKKKAIVFSKNEKLSRLTEIELILLGYSVEIKRSSKPSELEDADTIIFDATSEELILPPASPLRSCRAEIKLALTPPNDTRDLSAAGFKDTLEYPFSLEEFRSKLMPDSAFGSAANEPDSRHDTQKYFLADRKNGAVIFKDTYISLSEYELRILDLLCANAGNCVSRASLDECIGAESGNISDVYICHLRRKLELPFGIKVIYTVRGKGYITDYIIK